MTDAQAAARMGVTADQVDHLLGGGFDNFTFDQLFHYLNRLGHRVEIHLPLDSASPADAVLTVVAA